MTTAVGTLGRDVRVISLIGAAHSTSHFYQLVLPPIFPLLREAFGVGYTELGLIVTIFYATSGVMQMPAGFLVDRFGGRVVLSGGLALLGGTALLYGLAPNYWMMLPLAALAGIGNSVFHPADYSIIIGKVSRGRLGRAYSVHAVGGNIGWALAPTLMVLLSSAFNWRVAIMTVGAVGIAMAILVFSQPSLTDADTRPTVAEPAQPPLALKDALAALLSRTILLCFAYQSLMAAALTGVQTYFPVILGDLHGTPLAIASTGLTVYLLGSAAGILFGGIMADRSDRHDRLIAFGLFATAGVILSLGYINYATAPFFMAIGLAGFLQGTTSSSRDMVVRSVTPKGTAGRVFGFVYSGLDTGSALAALLFGALLDLHLSIVVIWAMVLFLVLAIWSIMAVRHGTVRAAQPAE
ncbi:MAG: MFS transporter [Proteobacteria bacterium]|nr:MFS transporter [Pseudomonadota bacterium]